MKTKISIFACDNRGKIPMYGIAMVTIDKWIPLDVAYESEFNNFVPRAISGLRADNEKASFVWPAGIGL